MRAGMPASSSHQHEANPPRRILVVEDDDVLRRVNAEVLMDSGYKVDAAENGAVAWTALQLFDYDLLVMDNDIPNVSGVDLLKNLYAARMTLPVIMVSGTMPLAELDRQPWLQIDAALLKPHTHAELLATVRNVLRVIGDDREQLAPTTGQSQPSVDRLRL